MDRTTEATREQVPTAATILTSTLNGLTLWRELGEQVARVAQLGHRDPTPASIEGALAQAAAYMRGNDQHRADDGLTDAAASCDTVADLAALLKPAGTVGDELLYEVGRYLDLTDPDLKAMRWRHAQELAGRVHDELMRIECERTRAASRALMDRAYQAATKCRQAKRLPSREVTR